MLVNIIVQPGDLGWIGGRLARELATRLPKFGFTAMINGHIHGDIEHHVIVYGPPERRPAVGMFTHGNGRPHAFARAFDGQIAMNTASLQYLIEGGATSPVLIDLPVADCFVRDHPIVFGVSGHVHADGRKGEHLVKAAVMSGYTFRAWGAGWPCEIVSERVEDLPVFYRGIDYLVDTSSDEGGCTPARECMAMGIPVISHTHGVEHPVIPYEKSSWPSLEKVLYRLTHPQTYDEWAQKHAAYFTQVLTGVAVG